MGLEDFSMMTELDYLWLQDLEMDFAQRKGFLQMGWEKGSWQWLSRLVLATNFLG
jgi:hypothetical protein